MAIPVLPQVPDKHLKIIGQIAAVWSRTEYAIQRLVVELATDDLSGGMFLTQNLGYQSRIDLLRVYASGFKELNPDQVRAWNKMLDNLTAAYGQRSKFVHGLWCEPNTAGEPTLMIFRVKSKLDLRKEAVPLSALSKTLDNILEAEAELIRVAKDYVDVDLKGPGLP